MTHHWHPTPTAAVDRAATTLTEAIRWLRTDQAAVMRQLPEQQTAGDWWASTHGGHADVLDTLPAWLSHYYDIEVDPNLTAGDLSRPASMVRQLLTSRAATVAAAPLTLVGDPSVRSALVTLARTPTYQNVRGWVDGSLPSATLLFTDPITFRHSVNTTGADPRPEHTRTPRNAHLCGVTWFHDNRLRCLDWVNVDLDSTGVAHIDDEIATHTHGRAHRGLPRMLTNGEWSLTGEQMSVSAARTRLQRATAFVRATGQRWTGEPIIDTAVVLAPAIAAAAADTIATQMMSLTPRRVRNRSTKPAASHRQVHLLNSM